MTEQERRLIAAAVAFCPGFPAITATRLIKLLPQPAQDRAGDAYAELFEASLDYLNSLPLDEQIAHHRERPDAPAPDPA